MISFDEAIRIVGDASRPLGIEQVPIGNAHRRVLAEPVLARLDSPRSDASAMDGYAVREEDLLRLPARLRLVGESFPGKGFRGAVHAGCCVRIFTGAPLPEGADRVVIQEVVRREGDTAVFDGPPGSDNYIRLRGSDFEKGALVLPAGTRLGYRQLVAAAGADVAELAVTRRPLVRIFATGDELMAPGGAAECPGAVPESLTVGVAAMADEWGALVTEQVHLRDDLNAMQETAARSLGEADLIVVTGGASVGEKDLARAMFERLGLELLFSKVAIKPGKPTWLGRVRGTLVLGLPGNPTSALTTARLLMVPLIAWLSGLNPKSTLQWRQVPLIAPLPAGGDRETFFRARAVAEGAEPLANQDSSVQAALSEADLLVRRPSGSAPAAAGERVSVLTF